MRAMNEQQFNLVKMFLDDFHIAPRTLVKKWNKYFWENGAGILIEMHEVYRAMLCVNYEVYKYDDHATEDVMLAMEGLKK